MTPAPAPAPDEALAATSLALARRFHAGATLWCWSPGRPSDAEHVAVEFVHPVIVGKPALPAIALGDGDAAAQLRRSTRPRDALVVIGSGADEVIHDVVSRAPAWALDVVWLAYGDDPPEGAGGARVVGLGGNADAADLVCAYHLLWELTHVCLEHPGALVDRNATPPSCPACMDAGDLGEVQGAGDGPDAVALVAGIRQAVDLSLVGPCVEGDLVVVHAGVAITKLGSAGLGVPGRA